MSAVLRLFAVDSGGEENLLSVHYPAEAAAGLDLDGHLAEGVVDREEQRALGGARHHFHPVDLRLDRQALGADQVLDQLRLEAFDDYLASLVAQKVAEDNLAVDRGSHIEVGTENISDCVEDGPFVALHQPQHVHVVLRALELVHPVGALHLK